MNSRHALHAATSPLNAMRWGTLLALVAFPACKGPDEGPMAVAGSIAEALSVTSAAAPSLPSPSANAAVLRAANNTVFVVGGTSGNAASDVFSLPNGAAAWTKSPKLDQARAGAGVGQLPNGNLLVFGGANGNGVSLATAVSYNPALGNGANAAAAAMATARSYAGYATDGAGNIYAIGGSTAGGPTASVEVYRPANSTWSARAPMPEALSQLAAAFDGGDHIYTFGGVTAGGAATISVHRYTISTNTWDDALIAALPFASAPAGAVRGPDDKFFVVTSGALLAYHLVGNFWTSEGGSPQIAIGLGRPGTVMDGAGRLLCIGGLVGGKESKNVTAISNLAEPVGPPAFVTSLFMSTQVAGVPFQYRAIAEGAPHATYSLVNPLPGMTVDAVSGLVNWTPAIAQIGPFTLTVRATNANGSVDQSASASVVGPMPDAPANLVAANIGETSFDLSFSPVVSPSGPVTYGVYTSVSCGRGCTGFIQIPATIVNTVATVSNRIPGQSGVFAVRAFAGGNVSNLSNIVVVKTLQASAPAGLTASNITQTGLTLSWQPSAGPAPILGYRLYEFGVLQQDNIAGLSTSVLGLQPGSVHTFDVRAFDAAGESPSSFLQVTTLLPPAISHTAVYVAESVVAIEGEQLMVIANTIPLTSTAATAYSVKATGNPAPTFSLVAAPNGASVDPVTGVVSWSPALGSAGPAFLTVRASNSEGSADLAVAVTVYPAGSDLLIPTNVPTYLTLTNVTRDGASFTWVPATDDKGVAGYNIYSQSPPTNCGRGVGCSGGPIVKAGVAGPDASYTIVGLTPGTAYAIWFEPFDAVGNLANTQMGKVLPLLRLNTLP